MASVVTYKCPNCDGELVFDPTAQRFACHYCGSFFAEEDPKSRMKAALRRQSRRQRKNMKRGKVRRRSLSAPAAVLKL